MNKKSIPDNKELIENNQGDYNSTKKLIVKKVTTFLENLDKTDDYKTVLQELNNLKEDIFEFTGGNKALYEISQIIKKVDNEQKITAPIKDIIKAKLEYWIKKMSN